MKMRFKFLVAAATLTLSASAAAQAPAAPAAAAPDESVLGEMIITSSTVEKLPRIAVLPSLSPDYEDVIVRGVVRRDFELTGLFDVIPDEKAPAGMYGFEDPVDVDAFYRILQDEYRTHVGPGHWFEVSRTSMRIGYGWPDAEQLRNGLENISLAAARARR